MTDAGRMVEPLPRQSVTKGVNRRTVIGTITDAAERFHMDGADVWEHICGGYFLASEGRLVRLEADPDKRQGTLWIVEEVEVS